MQDTTIISLSDTDYHRLPLVDHLSGQNTQAQSGSVPKSTSRRVKPKPISPLTRKIALFNLIALGVLICGIFYQNTTRDVAVMTGDAELSTQAALIAALATEQLQGQDVDADRPNVSPSLSPELGAELDAQPEFSPAFPAAADPFAALNLNVISLSAGQTVHIYDDAAQPLTQIESSSDTQTPNQAQNQIERGLIPNERRVLTNALSAIWSGLVGLSGRTAPFEPLETQLEELLTNAPFETPFQTQLAIGPDKIVNASLVSFASADRQRSGTLALISSTDAARELVMDARERMLRAFVLVALVSLALSVALANTISRPLSELARAAQTDRETTGSSARRVLIPDLTKRPDEIGRLSGALRGMVAALYERIDNNEEFAADIAHEIKNPLASLRSAVGTLRIIDDPQKRGKLLDVIEHDVRRLDRLVSDISNASRLDSELVREVEESFDLVKMLNDVCGHLSQEAARKDIDFVTDFPPVGEIMVLGLEERMAQVFVNLVSNAISFCEAGDAIRLWIRKRDERILVVVEDTGPGIPEEALEKIFERFYSERPNGNFGDHSGLGLAISKQIVEAHDGVIWAENIRRNNATPHSPPVGARFVVGLPS